MGTRADATREHIADCARVLFNQHGWNGFSRSTLANKANTSPATVINYYPTHRSLAFAAFKGEVNDLVALVVDGRAASDKASTPEDHTAVVRRFCEDLVETVRKGSALAFALQPLAHDPWTPLTEKTSPIPPIDLRELTNSFTVILRRARRTHGLDTTKSANLASHHIAAVVTLAANKRVRSETVATIIEAIL